MKLIKKLCVLSDGSLKTLYVQSFLNSSYNKVNKKDSRYYHFNQKKRSWKKKEIVFKPYKNHYTFIK